MKIFKRLTFIMIAGGLLFLAGCAGSTHSTIHYEGYYDPYPYWGYGDDTTIIIDPPKNGPERPTKPPGTNPPGGNRPKPKPKGR